MSGVPGPSGSGSGTCSEESGWTPDEEAECALLHFCAPVDPRGVNSLTSPTELLSFPVPVWDDVQRLQIYARKSREQHDSGQLDSELAHCGSSDIDSNDFLGQPRGQERPLRAPAEPVAAGRWLHLSKSRLMSATPSFCRDAALRASVSKEYTSVTGRGHTSPPSAPPTLSEAASAVETFVCCAWNAGYCGAEGDEAVYRSPWSGRYMRLLRTLPTVVEGSLRAAWEYEAKHIDANAACWRLPQPAIQPESHPLVTNLEVALNRALQRYMESYTPHSELQRTKDLNRVPCRSVTAYRAASAFVRETKAATFFPSDAAEEPSNVIEVIVIICRAPSEGHHPSHLVTASAFELQLNVAYGDSILVRQLASCLTQEVPLGRPSFSSHFYHCHTFKSASLPSCCLYPRSAGVPFGWHSICVDALVAHLLDRVKAAERMVPLEVLGPRSQAALLYACGSV